MIPNDVLTQLQSLIRTSAPPLLEVAESPTELPQWVPGQKINATVLASLPNGRFQVMVSDMFMDMSLPKNTQPGQSLELTFISNQPKLTFALSRDLETAGQAQSSVKLSDSARFLGGLLEKLSMLEKNGESAPLAKVAPLLTGAPEDTKQLAQVLHTALSKSGLFYESHQAQWVAGQRPLADLLQEPQGKLSSALASKDGAEISATSVHGTQQESTKTSAIADNSIPLQKGGTIEEKVHPQTMPMVQQQLDALDTRQVVWQGQVWPNQDLRWEISEREAREGDPEEMPTWQTRLRLQMPRMGDVTALLAFTPQGIKIDLQAADSDREGLMKGAQPELVQAFDRAGLKLAGVAIRAQSD